MRLIQPKEMIGDAIALAIVTFPIWIISGLFTGAMIGGYFESMKLFLLGALLPLGLIIGWAVLKNRKLNVMRTAMSNATKRGDTDYYYCTGINSIAISTQSREISILKSKQLLKTANDERLTFPIHKVLRYRAFAPGYTTVETQGSVISGGVNAAFDGMRNGLSQVAAATETGLYLELDDVMHPEVFVRMEFEDAKRWFLLFDKLAAGTLEKQEVAMFFPRNSKLAPV